ncbi:MAG: tetratricopeptide repeat protein [archaeon]|nr:tetratricopeptide repeat protein [archaeon]
MYGKGDAKGKVQIELDTPENEIFVIRKEIKDDYNKKDTRKDIVKKWKKVIKILQCRDIKLFLIAMKVLGDIYVEFEDYKTARYLYNFYKKESFAVGLLEETLFAYEALGNISKFLYKYQKAIKCYKKMIEIAWILKDYPMELRAYDHIGIQYFYLGNKEKARYYHERMIYGLIEKDSSKIKQSVMESFKAKHYHFFDDDPDRTYIRRERTNEELAKALTGQIEVYSRGNEKISLETYDILSNEEIMKNSFISDVDMSFQIIFEKSPEMQKYESSENEKKKKLSSKETSGIFNPLASDMTKENLANSDNLILSHLSSKRKDYNVERFEGLFARFDKELKEYMKKKYGK